MLALQPPSFFQRSAHHFPKIHLLTVLSFLSTSWLSCHLQLQESLKAMQGVCVFSSPREDSFVCGLQVGSEWHQAAAGVKAMAMSDKSQRAQWREEKIVLTTTLMMSTAEHHIIWGESNFPFNWGALMQGALPSAWWKIALRFGTSTLLDIRKLNTKLVLYIEGS